LIYLNLINFYLPVVFVNFLKLLLCNVESPIVAGHEGHMQRVASPCFPMIKENHVGPLALTLWIAFLAVIGFASPGPLSYSETAPVWLYLLCAVFPMLSIAQLLLTLLSDPGMLVPHLVPGACQSLRLHICLITSTTKCSATQLREVTA